jgi:hypothetical protein
VRGARSTRPRRQRDLRPGRSCRSSLWVAAGSAYEFTAGAGKCVVTRRSIRTVGPPAPSSTHRPGRRPRALWAQWEANRRLPVPVCAASDAGGAERLARPRSPTRSSDAHGFACEPGSRP